MTDRELLELAAKAAGYTLGQHSKKDWAVTLGGKEWNPFNDDRDALRLAVKLGISVVPYPIYEPIKHTAYAKQYQRGDLLREPNSTAIMEPYNGDPYAATRRAIVRAAAEIGRMKND